MQMDDDEVRAAVVRIASERARLKFELSEEPNAEEAEEAARWASGPAGHKRVGSIAGAREA